MLPSLPLLILLSAQAPTGSLTPAAQASSVEPEIAVLRHGEVIAQTWTTEREDGTEQDWYRMSLDGGENYGRVRATHYRLELRYRQFDPLRDPAPEVEEDLAADAEDHGLWIVQYVAKGVEPWREELRGLGAVDHRYLGNHANLWQMDAETAAEVAKSPFVRWVGPFHPAYKLEHEMLQEFRREGAIAPGRFNLIVGEWGPRQKAELVPWLQLLGGEVVQAHDEGWVVSAYLNGAQVLQAVHSPLVVGIDRWGAPEEDMSVVRNVMGAAYLETVAGYTGQGVRAEVMDSGLDTSHVDWGTPPILHTSNSSSAHGTCTYGINFSIGNSVVGGQTRGLLPDATGIFASYSSFGNRYTHTAELVDPLLNYRAVFQTNSWGGGRTFFYTSESQEMDDIIFINDLSILQSQSNAGNQDSRPQAWAKNVVSVGGINHYNNTTDADDAWSNDASIGPADDGRIKPDIAAYYDQVWTSDQDPGGYTGRDDHQNFGGTSAATPIVAGTLGLIYQMWADGVYGNPVGAGDVFDNRPHQATAKALLLNSSRQWQFSGTGHDLTRVHQGWGKPDLQRSHENGDRTFVIDEEFVLGDMEVASWEITVPAGEPELRATLVYADRAGTTSSSLHRINDLSLRLTSPGGTIYWGNNGLLAAMTSASGGLSNTKDTVEQVILANPEAGTWVVDVFADEVNQDTHVETGALDADFGLVITPVTAWTGSDPLNLMSLIGPTTPFPNVPTQYLFGNAEAGAPVWLLGSSSLGGTLHQGHEFDLGGAIVNVASATADGNGDGSFLITIPGTYSGATLHLEAASVAAGSWKESAPLQIDVR